MILDVKPFTEQADLMNNEITVDMFNIKIKIQNLINIFLILNVLLIIVFIIILMVHISTNIYTKLANLYESDRYKNHISKVFEMKETDMAYDCKIFTKI